MAGGIEKGYMAFIAEGREGIGAVADVSPAGVVVYVENAGEFEVPYTAIKSVHDQKVILDPGKLDESLLSAIAHARDREDPSVAG